MSEAFAEHFVTLDPTVDLPDARDHRRLGDALPSLDGVTIGLLSNGKTNGSELLRAVYGELAKRFEPAGAVAIRKDSVSVPPRPEDFARLVRETGAVITAIGD